MRGASRRGVRSHSFADQQRVSPHRIWHHEQIFREVNAEATEVRDRVEYVPPLGPLVALINCLAIRPQLEQVFEFHEPWWGRGGFA